MSLFANEMRRDLRAANRALARLRAELGEDAVQCAQQRQGHLPEARFAWEPLRQRLPARPRAVIGPPLVRRLHVRPLSLPPRPRHEPDGWLVAGLPEGPVDEVVGPHIVSGGWWMKAIERAYFFLRTRSGRWLWAFEDRKRNAWFLHGEVE
jgi:protein ImuB